MPRAYITYPAQTISEQSSRTTSKKTKIEWHTPKLISKQEKAQTMKILNWEYFDQISIRENPKLETFCAV